MKILRKNVKFLTNPEALDLARNLKTQNAHDNLVEYCKSNFNLDEINIKKEGLGRIGLYEFEILQLINFPPTQILDLQLVIEEMEERFDEDQLTKILSFFKNK